ncbi:MAG: diacylglycerol kinase family protein [Candidatus Omnitrophota bacterium]|jgi:diacylglycerol kinase (ATP)
MIKNKVFRNIFKLAGFGESFQNAGRGIIYLFLYHRNMRIIFMIGIAAFLLGFYLNLKGLELIALCITITLVFMAEIFNTAVELMMNTIADKYHIKIRLVKDIAAGIVVITCLNAAVIGYVLFIRKLIR